MVVGYFSTLSKVHRKDKQKQKQSCSSGLTWTPWPLTSTCQDLRLSYKNWEDTNGWSSQVVHISAADTLTCVGNIDKGVHDKKPMSLTPWLALKTLWTTESEDKSRKPVFIWKEKKRGGGEEALMYFFGRRFYFPGSLCVFVLPSNNILLPEQRPRWGNLPAVRQVVLSCIEGIWKVRLI